jgi:hypothetical protein
LRLVLLERAAALCHSSCTLNPSFCLGEFEGPPRAEVLDLSPEDVHGIVGWRDFYFRVSSRNLESDLHWALRCSQPFAPAHEASCKQQAVAFSGRFSLRLGAAARGPARTRPRPVHTTPLFVIRGPRPNPHRPALFDLCAQTYPHKGRAEGLYYTAAGEPTDTLRQVEARAAEGARLKEEKAKEVAKYTSCGMKYTTAEGGCWVGWWGTMVDESTSHVVAVSTSETVLAHANRFAVVRMHAQPPYTRNFLGHACVSYAHVTHTPAHNVCMDTRTCMQPAATRTRPHP